MPSNDERNRAKAGIRARSDAVKALIANHQDEFDKLHADNRLKAGLPRRSAGPSVEALQKRIEKAEERMKKWREELELAQSA